MASGVQRLEFVYEIEGNVDEIDVFHLAPALLSLGTVIQEANRTISNGVTSTAGIC